MIHIPGQTEAQNRLTQLGIEQGFNFHWNPDEKTWCLYGVGPEPWETDDYPADSRADAYEDALTYIQNM